MNNKRRMISIPIQVNNVRENSATNSYQQIQFKAAEKNIERHNRSKRNASGTMLAAKTSGLELKNGGAKSSNSGTLDELIGSVCQNNGCKVVSD
jgi:hypothetical protein